MTAEIIIVDDDEAVRDSLGLLLESRGFTVRVYASGLELLEQPAPPSDCCLLLDVRMPDIDGLELQRRLLARQPGLAVIVMTGHGEVPIAVRAMKQGAVDFLEKPFKEEMLLESVSQALRMAARSQQQQDQQSQAERKLEGLTPREREVLELLVAGHPNKVIAHRLDISPRTVEIHRARVMEKMEARNLSHLVRMALGAGLDPGET